MRLQPHLLGLALPSALLVIACAGGPSTTATTASATTDDETTGTTADELCYFDTSGGSAGADGPWIELYHGGYAEHGPRVDDGDPLAIVCGFQGAYMFEVSPVLGGFTPKGDYVYFDVWLDVEGHTEGFDGHFWGDDHLGILVGCIDDPYAEDPNLWPITFQILVHDEIDDVVALDGLPAHLHAAFEGDGMSVVVDYDLTLAAQPDATWEFCGYAP
ncbi:MAG: hypothetical protein R3A79_10755 [Nannocystaceae bacterium]